MEKLDTFLTALYIMIDDLCKSHQVQMVPAPGIGFCRAYASQALQLH